MTRCPQCGQENRAEARFCDACGASLVTPLGRREERKVVSVLFADLVDFTAAGEALDPEDVRAVQEPYWRYVRAEIERHGGTVEKFIGDAVVGLFGAPVAHEDDPERAVRAALAIRDWARGEEEIRVRIAITTGPALVRLDASPLAGEGVVSGDVINTASRLQNAAPTNGVLVDETTRRASRELIAYAEARPAAVKGKAAPVQVWEALEGRSRFGVDIVHHARTSLVGRDRELDVLKDGLARVIGERSPLLVTLVGVPGIGKSRLVYELMQVLEADGQLVNWRQGRSLPYGDGVSFWALGEIVKAHAGILETDGNAEAESKLLRATHALVDKAAEAEWLALHARPLVGLSGESEGRIERDETFAAWRRFLEALAERRPTVLIFEDLHWADDALIDFVDSLIEWVGDVPLLVVATARPELLERRPTWAGGKPNATTLSLAPLSEDETARLVDQLVEGIEVTPEAERTLVEHAAGNPLYAEQYARMWQERDRVDELPPPETVQAIIAARLDGLAPSEKSLLQDGAVFGTVFWVGAIFAISDLASEEVGRRLHALERKEFVRRSRHSSVEDETEYAFRHVLIRDVVYGQIPRVARAEKHERAGGWISRLGRVDDQAEMIAHHYLRALELNRLEGQSCETLATDAQRALIRAGDRALAVNASASAGHYYRQALQLTRPKDQRQPLLLFGYGRALFAGGDEKSVEALEDAIKALLAAGDVERAAEGHALLAEVWWLRGDQERVDDHVRRARAHLDAQPLSVAKARVVGAAARFATLAYAPDAVRLAREALVLAEQIQQDELVAQAMITLGIARWNSGDLPGAVTDVESGLGLALAHNALWAAFRGYTNLAFLAGRRGLSQERRELLRQAERLGQRLGNPVQTKFVQTQLIAMSWAEGNWDEALERTNQFIAECEAGSAHTQEPWVRMMRARARIARADEAGALDDIEQALALARRNGAHDVLIQTLALGLDRYLRLDRVDEARVLAEEARSYDPDNDDGYLLWILAWRKDLLGLTDSELEPYLEGGAASHEREVARLILAGDYKQLLERLAQLSDRQFEADVRLRAAKQLVQEGSHTRAVELADKALAFYKSVGATRDIREVERLRVAISREEGEAAQPHS